MKQDYGRGRSGGRRGYIFYPVNTKGDKGDTFFLGAEIYLANKKETKSGYD